MERVAELQRKENETLARVTEQAKGKRWDMVLGRTETKVLSPTGQIPAPCGQVT